MDARLRAETERLARSWQRHEAAWLRDYLVASVEDPRLSPASVLTRHFLIEAILGDRELALMEAELRFALGGCWLVKQVESGAGPEDFAAVRHALAVGADNAEGEPLPAYLQEAWAVGPEAGDEARLVRGALEKLLDHLERTDPPKLAEEPAMNTMLAAWRERLAEIEPTGWELLEPACGSANDYRALAACGLDRLFRYRGLDLSEKNIANARALFPQARFEVGNVFALPAPDRGCELLFVHDLFEHLSPEGLEAAVAEVCRVTARAMCLGFFNMREGEPTRFRPVEEYHWNTLGAEEMRDRFERRGFAVQVVNLAAFLREAFGCEDFHNPGAYLFRCWRQG